MTKIENDILDGIREYDKARSAIGDKIISFMSDQKFNISPEVELCALLLDADRVYSTHDSNRGQYVYNGVLVLDTFEKDLDHVTEADIETAFIKGQAIYVEELLVNDLIWLFDQYLSYTQQKTEEKMKKMFL